MNYKKYSCRVNYQSVRILLLLFLFISVSCAGDGGGGTVVCDIVPSLNPESRLEINNTLSTGMQVVWPISNGTARYSLRPSECFAFELPSGEWSFDVTQCDIGSEGCAQLFGNTVAEFVVLATGETVRLDIDVSYFQ